MLTTESKVTTTTTTTTTLFMRWLFYVCCLSFDFGFLWFVDVYLKIKWTFFFVAIFLLLRIDLFLRLILKQKSYWMNKKTVNWNLWKKKNARLHLWTYQLCYAAKQNWHKHIDIKKKFFFLLLHFAWKSCLFTSLSLCVCVLLYRKNRFSL